MLSAIESRPAIDSQSVFFRCIAGCSAKHSIYDVLYTCPSCGNLLEVHHEREPLEKRERLSSGSSCSTRESAPQNGLMAAAYGECASGSSPR